MDTISNRARMSISNSKARKYLEELGYHHIHIRRHVKWEGDLMGLFDGFCYSKDDKFSWLQIKTNHYPNMELYRNFFRRFKQSIIIIIVKTKPDKIICRKIESN